MCLGMNFFERPSTVHRLFWKNCNFKSLVSYLLYFQLQVTGFILWCVIPYKLLLIIETVCQIFSLISELLVKSAEVPTRPEKSFVNPSNILVWAHSNVLAFFVSARFFLFHLWLLPTFWLHFDRWNSFRVQSKVRKLWSLHDRFYIFLVIISRLSNMMEASKCIIRLSRNISPKICSIVLGIIIGMFSYLINILVHS